MSIRSKLFLILLLITATVVVGMFGFTRWSIQRGFVEFVEARQAERVEQVREVLAEHYLDAGDWSALATRPRLWLDALRGRDLRERLADAERHEASAGRAPPPRRWQREWLDAPAGEWPPRALEARWRAQGRPLALELRIMLLDAEQGIVQGRSDLLGDSERLPIEAAGRTVGYLALLPGPGLAELGEIRFLQRQTSSILIIAVIAVALSAAVAAALAARLTRPLGRFRDTARALASGNYEARIGMPRDDELGRLAADLDMLADTLAHNEGARRQWVADIAHELRTPIAVMRGELEALQDGVRTLSPAAVDSLHADAVRLQRLVDDLHELSLTDLGALSYRMRPVDLQALLDADVQAFETEFNAAGIAVQTSATAQTAWVDADAGRLSQLFRNLLRNTLRYTDAPGQLQVRVARSAERLHVTFDDSAPGVPAQALPRLFERLYRVDASRSRQHGGAGLGLAICHNIASAHGGTLHAEASALGGLRIILDLPRGRGEPATQEGT